MERENSGLGRKTGVSNPPSPLPNPKNPIPKVANEYRFGKQFNILGNASGLNLFKSISRRFTMKLFYIAVVLLLIALIVYLICVGTGLLTPTAMSIPATQSPQVPLDGLEIISKFF